MDFITGLPVLTDWKKDSYNLIHVIVNRLIKMIYYNPVKVNIDALSFAEVIINMIVRHHSLFDSIVTNRGLLFISKFWSSLCYFFDIKRRLSIALYPQTNGQTKRQNSTMEVYLRVFVNFKQNDWAGLLPWLSLFTITPRILAPATLFLSLIADTIFVFFIKKNLIPAQNQKPQKNYLLNFKSW